MNQKLAAGLFFGDLPQAILQSGAIGFDWIMRGLGGVPWLISWPRKKLIKQQLLTSR